MEKRTLGRTELKIAPIGFGAMELMYTDQKQADYLLNAALDNGINYFDTSREYPKSEERIGNAISHRRGEFILATKCCDNMTGIGPDYIFDRKTCISNLEESLRDLKTDYIDVWQIHAVIPEYLKNGENDEVIECMLEAKKAGKVRSIGLTIKNGKPEEERYPAEFGYQAINVFSNWKAIDIIQLVYGGLTRRSENRIKVAADSGVGIVARGVIKKYKDSYDEIYEKSRISELFEVNETRNDFLLRFVLTNPSIACMVIGTKNPEHLLNNIKTVEKGCLSQEVFEEAKRRLDAVGVIPGEV